MGAVAVGILVAAVCVAIGVFLHGQGLARAGAWAGIIGLLGLPLGALGVWLAWPRGGDGAAHTKVQNTTASDGGTAFVVMDGDQVINNHGSMWFRRRRTAGRGEDRRQ